MTIEQIAEALAASRPAFSDDKRGEAIARWDQWEVTLNAFASRLEGRDDYDPKAFILACLR